MKKQIVVCDRCGVSGEPIGKGLLPKGWISAKETTGEEHLCFSCSGEPIEIVVDDKKAKDGLRRRELKGA